MARRCPAINLDFVVRYLPIRDSKCHGEFGFCNEEFEIGNEEFEICNGEFEKRNVDFASGSISNSPLLFPNSSLHKWVSNGGVRRNIAYSPPADNFPKEGCLRLG
jgi:hypothetical protein